jgi:ankyrin repeat protein
MTAATRGYEDIVKQLINANADLDRTSNCVFGGHSEPYLNLTILQLAAIEGRQESVSILLDAGASVDARNVTGRTALMIACVEGQEAVVSQLIEAEGSVDAKDQYGHTALMEACRWGHEGIVSQLIQAGADVNITTNKGETIPMIAAMRDNEDIVKQLINANADLDRTSHCLFPSNSGTGYSNLTILQAAAIAGRQESVGILLDAGASVDARNNRGLTALMCACREGNESIVTQLLEAGSDALASDNDGNPVADYAKKTGNREIINAVEKAIKSSYTLSLSRENRLGNIPTSGINSSNATMETGRALGELSIAAQKTNPSQDAPRPR